MDRMLLAIKVGLVTAIASSFSSFATPEFDACKLRLRDQATQSGVSQPVADRVFDKLVYQPRVIELDRSQPEFVQTFPNYFGKRVTDWRVEKGQQMYDQHKALLDKLNHQYGIPPHYLIAFWGLETNFGTYKGKMPVLDSLATLACDPRRSDFFTKELITAVKLLERESLEQEKMVGSWAGAMGHTQFMPSAYARYAIDGDDDGRVDLWESEEDALTSAANFLAELGWQPGYRWGREVKLPDGFDYDLAGYSNRRPLTEWQEIGVTKANGQPLGEGDLSSYIVVPAGYTGPAFIAYPNFRVIMRWNNSEFYAIAVGHLADRIIHGAKLDTALPELPTYSRDDIIALQTALNDAGFEVGKPDGIIGPATRKGIRAFQRQHELIADGFPSLEVMEKAGVELRQAAE